MAGGLELQRRPENRGLQAQWRGLDGLAGPSDRSLVGGLLLEDLAPTPPGSPVPFVASQLVDEDPIEKKIQVRITICDKGSDAVKIGEVEF